MKTHYYKKVLSLLMTLLLFVSIFVPSIVDAQDNNQEETSQESDNNSKQENTDDIKFSYELDDVLISVNASSGAFPDGSYLFVEKVENNNELDEVLEEVRDNNKNVVASYTFDIKIFDSDNNEVQPSEDSSVKVSFSLLENENANLDANIYHIDDDFNVEELQVELEEEVISVETDGFSFYTVEFTYNNKEYVLDGDSKVSLKEILDFVGLSGKVSSYEISDNTLFDIREENGELYVYALQPFLSEEWLDIEIDGIKYRIVVTDDYQAFDGSIVTVDGVTQGGNLDNFTAKIGTYDIEIDTSVLSDDVSSRNASIPKIAQNYAGYTEFEFFNPTIYGGDDSVFLSLNVDKAKTNGRSLPTTSGTIHKYDGDIIEYKFVDGAYSVYDRNKKYDVVITYSNLEITFGANGSFDMSGMSLGLVCGNMVGLGACKKANPNMGTVESVRYGIKVDVNIKVVDKSEAIVPGSFIFPMVDIDVVRPDSNLQGWYYMYDASNRGYYSEQVELKSGSYIGDIFIPGGDYTGFNPSATNYPYLSKITKTSSGHLIEADHAYTEVSGGRNKDFYTGFVTIADNTNGGIKLSFLGSSANLITTGANRRMGIDTYFILGKPPIPSKLTIEKKSTNVQMETDPDFDFEIQAWTENAGVKKYFDFSFLNGFTLKDATNGIYSFKLKKNTSINLDGVIPLGFKYKVSEVTNNMPSGWSFVSVTNNNEGTAVGNDTVVTFTNKYTTPIVKLKLRKITENNLPGSFNFKITVTNKVNTNPASSATTGSNYKVSNDDIAMYRINPAGYTYRWFDHNNGDFRAKQSSNPSGNWASTVGPSAALGTLTTQTTANGNALLRLYNAALGPDGSTKDIVILFRSATITPVNGNNVDASTTQLFHGQLNGAAAFAPGNNENDSQYSRTFDHIFDVSTDATIYITEPNDNTPLEGTMNLTFSNVEDVLFGTNTLKEEVKVDGNDIAANASGIIDITANSSGTAISLKAPAKPGIIHIMPRVSNQYKLTLSSGENGKIQTTTNGKWENNGGVSSEGKILDEATYGVANGKSITVKLTPREGYELDTLTVNGVSRLADAVANDGFYFLNVDNITQDTNINVTWKTGYTPHEPTNFELRYYNLSNATSSRTYYTNDTTLTNNQTKEFGIPLGYSYLVEEVVQNGWNLVSSTNTTGTITGRDIESVFTNRSTSINNKPAYVIPKTGIE